MRSTSYNSKGTAKGTVKVQVLKVQLIKRYKEFKKKVQLKSPSISGTSSKTAVHIQIVLSLIKS